MINDLYNLCFRNYCASLIKVRSYEKEELKLHQSLLGVKGGGKQPSPANNGEPFRFRIGSVKSAQLFQLSAENFFRLRYESVPPPVTRN